jgi:hypothetical protein
VGELRKKYGVFINDACPREIISMINAHAREAEKDLDSVYIALIITLQLYFFHAYSLKKRN